MIGDRIRQYRLQKNLSLSELAERAGVAKSYLSAIERYIQVNPSIHVLERLAAVLDVPVHVLIEAEDTSSTAVTGDDNHFDPDWLNIVREAMNSGVSKEEFRQFLEFQKWRRQGQD
ncbi:helix-turn-helix domain-containing protein [Alicyclobacillus sp. ALC3]|uniref:helix-turn-helix domain-containing protein n=1 Tax=Alicyclobacillus sp. ALC3 TaxID=2796143 RepID=UPI002379469E|nr:helix-turn-helix domain-containing protein [Alicyclobacillus sp. ALC3]WDL97997.1 helix-turn-helix domain-containing protein [Alicyclobacillus sp. ALC3]